MQSKLNKIKSKKGSAMILTMFILAGMLIVAMGGSYIILIGIKAGGIQAQSTKAYFAAESGVEEVLWSIRSGALQQSPDEVSQTEPCISGSMGVDSEFNVFFTNHNPRTYLSVGDSRNTKRGVEVSW